MQQLSSQLEDTVVTIDGVTHKLSDHLRKTYAVEVHAGQLADDGLAPVGTGWERQPETYNNSTDANAAAAKLTAAGEQARVVVVEISNVPKKSFWDLWRAHKKLMQAAGIFVTKAGEQFVIADRKPTRREIVRAKGYGWSDYNRGLRNGDPMADYILQAKCRGEFDALEAEGYGHLVTEGDRRIEAEHQDREDGQ